MSLTNNEAAMIKSLFDKMIAAGGSNNYMLTNIDNTADTYYEEPKHPEQAYFSFIDTSSEDALAAYLKTFWAALGTPEFAAGADTMSELAFLLKAGTDTQTDEISPFIYAMY